MGSGQQRRRGLGRQVADVPLDPYLGEGLVGFKPTASGAIRRFRRPRGVDLRQVQQRAVQRVASAERQLPGLLDEMREVAYAADPLQLYSRLTMLAAMRRAMPGEVSFGSDAVLEFFGGLVTAMPADDVVARVGTDYDPQVLYDLDRLLREYAIAQNRIHEGRALREGAATPLDSARHLLEFEHRFDRMLGYPAQLRPIFEAITAALADRSRPMLGFALGDALTAADAYQAVLAERARQTVDVLQPVLDAIPTDADPATRLQHLALHAAGVATFAAAPVEEDLAGLLAERTGIDQDELIALIAALATPLGSQAGLENLHERNTLRRRPIVSLPGGRHFWPSPGDLIHAALDWAADTCQPHPALIAAFDRARQASCEELTFQAFAAVFGDDHVHAAVTYPADGQRPDIDVLMANPGATIVVEAKGGRFTDPARRGAPERIRKKSNELADKPLAQNARTIAHLRHGGADLRDRNKRRLAIPNSSHIVSVIVTLDRVDPFATHLPDGGKRGEVPDEGTWLVNLADLLMVADVLRHPSEFYAYAELRARITKAGAPRIFVEADALGLWCEQRLTPAHPAPGELILLNTTSHLMNDYYTFVPTDTETPPPPRPTSHTPHEVLDALTEVLDHRPEHWHHLTIEALSVPPARWTPVKNALNRTGTPPRSRRNRKHARRAESGLHLTDHLTIRVTNNADEQTQEMPSTSLVITPDRTRPATKPTDTA